jgi:hypothetical protein
MTDMANGNWEEYHKLLEKLNVDNPNDVDILLNAINKMSRDQLRVLFHFLFPEDSEPNEETNQMMEALKEKGKDHFRVKRDNNGVDIEIL